MNIKIKSKEEYKTSQWSGGETIELLIFPSNSSYASRDFDFRISSATVRLEESVFTSLPGFSRKLMVLDGQVTLRHQGHHEITLKKYDVDAFEGDWQTTSFGTCTDFNVMTNSKFGSELWAEHFEADEKKALTLESNAKWLLVYVASGSIEISDQRVLETQLVVIENQDLDRVSLLSMENSTIILIKILQEVSN